MQKPTADIVVPVYNEAPYLYNNIKRIYDVLKNENNFKWQILIGENGSTDNSFEIAKQLEKEFKGVKAFHLMNINSKGKAIGALWKQSKADILAFTDADLSAEPKFLIPLIKAVMGGNDIAVGFRFHSKYESRGIYRDLTSFVYNNLVLPIFLNVGTKDAQCGFKAINRRVADEIVSKMEFADWFFDSELLAVAYAKGFKIKEVPLSWKETRKGSLNIPKSTFSFISSAIKLRRKLANHYYD
jgi:glycosyltransferase involved in cell wall biosynthesis